MSLSLAVAASALYLPGVTPNAYTEGQSLSLKVNSLTSVQTAIPFDHYSLSWCPGKDAEYPPDVGNFGQILYGDVVRGSPYDFTVLRNVSCRAACGPENPSREQKKLFNKRIEQLYHAHFLLDDLPVTTDDIPRDPQVRRRVVLGLPIGAPGSFFTDKRPRVYNHLAFTVRYHIPANDKLNASLLDIYDTGSDIGGSAIDGTDDAVGATSAGAHLVGGGGATAAAIPRRPLQVRIVGFTVTPHSIDHSVAECDTADFVPAAHGKEMVFDESKDGQKVVWSYSVTWLEDPSTAWAMRWDVFIKLGNADHKVHLFSVVNSTLVLFFLSLIVVSIFVRALRRDLSRYNDEIADDVREESGWKLVHGDVFRAPPHPGLLAATIGTGCQLAGMTALTLGFALLGLMSPAKRGALLTSMLLVYAFLGTHAGFVTARLAKMFHRQSWRTIALCAFLFPGLCFTTFFICNLLLWSHGATSAVPFYHIVILLGLWVLVCTPLVVIGGIFGYRRPPIDVPVQTHPIPRSLPPAKWWFSPWVTVPVAGCVPFGAVYMQLYYIMSSMWLGQMYYVFGFLFASFAILCLTCAQISVVLTYFQLCYEDYRWWWRSFFTSGSAGLHLFLYAAYYFGRLRGAALSTAFFYFAYMALAAVTFGIVTGTVGFLASFLFVRKIYGAVKVD